jgi:hypothetical protein
MVSGTYYLYGEAYGNQTLATPYPWSNYPRLNVYTSPDLVSWTLRGDPLPMIPGTLWIPNVVYHEPTKKFIMWFGSGGSVDIRPLSSTAVAHQHHQISARCLPPLQPTSATKYSVA